ncbi:MAG: DUF302 domain-containing protein [Armatimonadota bacterium]
MADMAMKKQVTGSFEGVRARVIEALKAQGFGVLTEINVQQTLREKIGAEIEQYAILGACNPQLAFQALSENRDVGLLLPCTVVVREMDGPIEVSILNPEVAFLALDRHTQEKLAELPAIVKTRMQAALDSL